MYVMSITNIHQIFPELFQACGRLFPHHFQNEVTSLVNEMGK